MCSVRRAGPVVGSAAAVAAGMCPAAVGSHTLQSAIVPAAYCAVVGYKPTYERLHYDGVALSPAFDTIGILTASVQLADTIAAQVLPDWIDHADTTTPVIGVPPPWGLRRLHTQGRVAFDHHANQLRHAGSELRHAMLPWNEELHAWAQRIGDLLHGQMARLHTDWCAEYRALYRPRAAAAIERGMQACSERITECETQRDILRDQLRRTTQSAGVDFWICPSTGSMAPMDYDNAGDNWRTSFWSYAGWPQLSLPVFDGPDGLPYGLQLIAPDGGDEELLLWARTIHSALRHGIPETMSNEL